MRQLCHPLNTQDLEGEAEDGEDVAHPADQTATEPTTRLHRLPNKPLTLHAQKGSSRYYVGSNRSVGLYEAMTKGSNEARACSNVTRSNLSVKKPWPRTY